MLFDNHTKSKIDSINFRDPHLDEEEISKIRSENLEFEKKVRESQHLSDESLYKRFTI